MAKAKRRAGKSQHPKVKAGTNKQSLEQRKSLFAKAMIANGGNKYQAAISAGYKAGPSAERAASRLSGDVRVLAMIEADRNKALQAADITTERVLQEVGRLAFHDVRRMFDENGNLKKPHELDDDTAAALAGIDVYEEYAGRGESRQLIGFTRKVKIHNKNDALEKLMKHFGLYEKDNKQQADALAALLGQIDGAVLRPAGAAR